MILSANTVVANPASGDIVPLLAGSRLPDWAEGLVANHLLIPDSEPVADDAPEVSYKKWKKADLLAEIAARNEGRDEDEMIKPESDKNEALVAALEADDLASETTAGDAPDDESETEDN